MRLEHRLLYLDDRFFDFTQAFCFAAAAGALDGLFYRRDDIVGIIGDLFDCRFIRCLQHVLSDVMAVVAASSVLDSVGAAPEPFLCKIAYEKYIEK